MLAEKKRAARATSGPPESKGLGQPRAAYKFLYKFSYNNSRPRRILNPLTSPRCAA